MELILNRVYWFLMLVLVSWWVATISFVLYLVFGVLSVCFPMLRELNQHLLNGVRFPEICCANMLTSSRPDSLPQYQLRDSYTEL